MGAINLSCFLSLSISLFALFAFHFLYEEEKVACAEEYSHKPARESFCHLTLFPEGSPSILPDFSRLISFIGYNTRPDATDDHSAVALALGKGRVGLKRGETAYLRKRGDAWELTHEQTPLSVVPGENYQVTLLLELDEISHQEVFDLPVVEQGDFLEKEALLKGKMLPPDRLFARYGGERYAPLGGMMRLKQEGRFLTYLKEGMLLIWDGLEWRVPKKWENTTSFSLARVCSDASSFDVWDITGFRSARVTLARSLPPVQKGEIKIEDVCQRTKSRVSCRIDGRGRLMTKGDWLLKTVHGWQRIDSPEDVRKILNYRLEGELFIFDGIEEVGTDLICRGTVFDASRSHEQTISTPMKRLRHREKDRPLAKRIREK